MIYLLCGYMWLFIHRPFEVWPWLGDFHIERIYMIITLAYWATCVEKRWIANRLNPAFLMLAAAILAAAALTPYPAVAGPTSVTVQNWFKIAVFYVLVLTSVREERELKILLAAFVLSFGLFMLHSLREFLCGAHAYRMGVARMVGVGTTFSDPNTFGNSIIYALPMVIPLWGVAQRGWQRWGLVAFIGLSVLCLLLTGSRSSFVGLCVLCFAAALMSRYRFVALVALAVAAPIAWMNLREDLQNRYLTLIDPSRGPANAKASADSRIMFFWQAIGLWSEYPVSGVGPGAFGAAIGHGIQAHNLYGQVLAELGTAGGIALLAIILGFSMNMRQAWRFRRGRPELDGSLLYRTCWAAFITVPLLLLLGLGGHNMFRYTWLWYGAFQVVALRLLQERIAELPAGRITHGDLRESSSRLGQPAFSA